MSSNSLAATDLPAPTVHNIPAPQGRAKGKRGKRHCQRNACTSTRINAQCTREKCRKHCLEDGGCEANGHESAAVTRAPEVEEQSLVQPSGSTQATSDVASHQLGLPKIPRSHSSPASLDATFSTSSAPISRPRATTLGNGTVSGSIQVQAKPAARPPASLPKTVGKSGPVDSLADPIHATHLASVFTKEYERMEHQNAHARQRSANILETQRRSQQHLVVHCWLAVRPSYLI